MRSVFERTAIASSDTDSDALLHTAWKNPDVEDTPWILNRSVRCTKSDKNAVMGWSRLTCLGPVLVQ